MTFSVFTITKISEASTRSFQVKCSRINIKHKDDLIILYISQNFSIEKMNDFIIKGNQATITVDKSNINPEVTLPDDFSGLKTQINKQEKIVALDNIKSIEIQGNIQFIAKRNRIKLTATRIKSVDGAVTFNIENPKLIKTSSKAQDINIKANATLLDTKTNTITLTGNCTINVLDATTKANLSGSRVIYKYKTGSISATGSSGTIITKGYEVNYKANSINYSIKTSNAELTGLNSFLIKNKDISARFTAKNIFYTPISIKAKYVNNLDVTNASNDSITASTDEIIYSVNTESFTLGKNTKVNWQNTREPSLSLITNSVSVNLKNQFVSFNQRSAFTFNKDYLIEANAGSYNRKSGFGIFNGNVIVKDASQSAVNCDSVEFTFTKDMKRIELKNLKESKLNIKE